MRKASDGVMQNTSYTTHEGGWCESMRKLYIHQQMSAGRSVFGGTEDTGIAVVSREVGSRQVVLDVC